MGGNSHITKGIYMLGKVLALVLVGSVVCFTGCTDKVAYVGYGDNECKYTEVNGVLKTCDGYDNTYEIIWVDSCLIPSKKDGVKPSTFICEENISNGI